jgi:hypothetical protein
MVSFRSFLHSNRAADSNVIAMDEVECLCRHYNSLCLSEAVVRFALTPNVRGQTW